MSKSSDELRQALKIGGSEKKKGNLRYGYGIDVWGMLSFPLTLTKSPFPFMIIHSDVGAHLNLLLWMDRVGLLLLLMIVPG